MTSILALPGDASLLLRPLSPALGPADAAILIGALDRLFAQYQREERLARWAVETLADGAILAIAFCGAPLSGCSHDKLAALLAHVGQRLGRCLLDAPPIVLELDGHACCLTRQEVRDLASAGRIGPLTGHWDLSLTTVASWRQQGRTTVGASWLARLLPTPRVPA